MTRRRRRPPPGFDPFAWTLDDLIATMPTEAEMMARAEAAEAALLAALDRAAEPFARLVAEAEGEPNGKGEGVEPVGNLPARAVGTAPAPAPARPRNRNRGGRPMPEAATVESDTPLAFLLTLMADEAQPVEVRMRAAGLALPFMHAKPAAPTKREEATRRAATAEAGSEWDRLLNG